MRKDGEERSIRLGPKLASYLQAHRKRHAEERMRAGPDTPWERPELVFPNPRGQVVRDSTLHDHFKRILRFADLPDIRFHDLRYTAATLMLRTVSTRASRPTFSVTRTLP